MIENYIREMSVAIKAIRDIQKTLGGQSEYKMERILSSHTHMFDRFCPFKVGDRIELASTPKIDKDTRWGWLGSKHYLIEGSPGVVVSRDYYKGRFSFDIKMDLESWVQDWGEDRGKWKSVSDRHTYCFYEGTIRSSTKEEWLIHKTEGAAPKWVGDLIGDK